MHDEAAHLADLVNAWDQLDPGRRLLLVLNAMDLVAARHLDDSITRKPEVPAAGSWAQVQRSPTGRSRFRLGPCVTTRAQMFAARPIWTVGEARSVRFRVDGGREFSLFTVTVGACPAYL